MKPHMPRSIKLQIAVLFIAISFIIVSCAPKAMITLTPEQQNINILQGDQATTLSLMNTHIPICTEQMISEYAARVRALALNADIAQLILTYNEFGAVTHTFRFWKPK